ncbi:MAG: YtxH domain-containing protein [Blastocatellia bacterium]|nr:YtxH domain-containing protein [Blastocatellia bacterium]
MSEDRDYSSKLTYFLVGAGIGAVVALLFAPKSGQELRGDIKDATRRSVDYANDNVRALSQKAGEIYATGREKAADIYHTGREKTHDIVETGREVISEQKDRVAAAIEAGKRAYQEKKAEGRAAVAETSEQS